MRQLLALAALVLAAARPSTAQQLIGLDALTRIDQLPRFRPSVAVGSVSSYDRTGGNDDGFSGKYSFVRKEPGGLVIADLQGPGVVYRIWTPTPTGDPVEFYFDGEATPRLTVPFRDLFTGKTFPFLAPVSGIGAGGFYTYVPLAYARSLKILVKAERVQFYQINYATYPAGTAIESYAASDAATARYRADLERAQRLVAATGADPAAGVAATRARDPRGIVPSRRRTRRSSRSRCRPDTSRS